jgi:hypothetical protein
MVPAPAGTIFISYRFFVIWQPFLNRVSTLLSKDIFAVDSSAH